MFTVQKGDIFLAIEDTITDPVNCVGVCGKGLAKQFAERYPDEVYQYRRMCAQGSIALGKPMFLPALNNTKYPSRNILFFPTKNHWRAKSRLTDIVDGISYVKTYANYWGIKSLAVPLLGAGLGGLPAEDVMDVMHFEFSDFPLEVVLYTKGH